MDGRNKLKRKIQVAFKSSGLTINSETCDYLSTQLSLIESESEITKFIDEVIEKCQNIELITTNIDKKHIENAIKSINQSDSEEEPIFSVINAFDENYCKNKSNNFELNTERQILSRAESKIKFLRERYTILYNIIMRKTKLNLLYVEKILLASEIENVVTFGMLTQFKEGEVSLEDLSGVVELKLTNAEFDSGFFCDGCFVMVEGRFQDNILYATRITLPPVELIKDNQLTHKLSPRLINFEKHNTDATIIFLSDVRLDLPIVLEKLKTLFLGFDDCPPVAIVLMGPFCKPNESSLQKIKENFKNLADISTNCVRLTRETELILIPSLDDIGGPSILPKAPISESLVDELKKKWNCFRLATNPCRLQYCTQQIIVYRADLMAKFGRNTYHFPESDLANHFAQTLISQRHLAPIYLNALPVHWDYDFTLHLNPLPNVLVIGDVSNSFTTTQSECLVFNTGSFLKSKFAFKVYLPSTRTVDDSEIPDTD